MNPRIKIEQTKKDFLIESLQLIFLLATIGITIYNWRILPEDIPIHRDLVGNIDDYGSKFKLLIIPLLGIAFYLVFRFLSRRPHILNYPNNVTLENAKPIYRKASLVIRLLCLSILVLFFILTINTLSSSIGTDDVVPINVIWLVLTIISLIPFFLFFKNKKT